MKYLVVLWFMLLCSSGCERETHHYRITDLSTGKVYIAEENNLTDDQPGYREIRRHILSPGVIFTVHDGTRVEIDGSFSYQKID